MSIWDYLRDDWEERLPYHLRYNRYRGTSRICFQLLCLLYYAVKLVLILLGAGLFAAYKYLFLAIGTGLQWLIQFAKAPKEVRRRAIKTGLGVLCVVEIIAWITVEIASFVVTGASFFDGGAWNSIQDVILYIFSAAGTLGVFGVGAYFLLKPEKK